MHGQPTPSYRGAAPGARRAAARVQEFLDLAVREARTSLDRATAASLEAARNDLTEAQIDLRELAAGIHPAILTEQGLGPALASLAGRAPVPVRLAAPA